MTVELRSKKVLAPLEVKKNIIEEKQCIVQLEEREQDPDLLSRKKGLPKKKSIILTRSCNEIFQGRLPQKKHDLESLNSIGKLPIKEARYGLGESINSTPSLLIRKIEEIQVKPSNFTLTLTYRSINKPLEVVEDAMVEADKTLETQKKTHLLQESWCSVRRTSTYPEILMMGACEHLLLLAKFMEFLLNKRKMKDDVFFLSYKPP
ncbi:hypothetical protein MTR_4g036475 [Medicago truncatula]|uniref:Uncharacterized protein n=1 Tax=Medicago truncatula TaxID=3880 RepID=A0A072UK31_MEDTR|nr:hypothetical protein MTR_4g036475 [Medicago truncatula]